MKIIQLNQLEIQSLLTQKESLSIEHNGKIVGYYYPKIDDKEVTQAKEELDIIMERVLAETGLTEEEYVSRFMNQATVLLQMN